MDEKEVIAACLQGKGEGYRHIVDIYTTQVRALAMNILGNREDAEDACQETFIQVFRHLAHFDARKSFKNWILTIVTRRCLDQIKKKRRFQRAFVRIKNESSPEACARPPYLAEKKQLSRELLKHLSPKERTVLALWANEGFTSAEISEVLRCSSSTVRVYLFNARKKIKPFLEKDHVAF